MQHNNRKEFKILNDTPILFYGNAKLISTIKLLWFFQECSLASDPFTAHLNGEFSPSMLESICGENTAVAANKLKWPYLGNLVIQMPKVEKEMSRKPLNKKPLLEEEKVLVPLI